MGIHRASAATGSRVVLGCLSCGTLAFSIVALPCMVYAWIVLRRTLIAGRREFGRGWTPPVARVRGSQDAEAEPGRENRTSQVPITYKWRSSKGGDRMNAETELRRLGFAHAGAICARDGGKNCLAEIPGDYPEYAVWAFVVDNEIKRFGYTSTGLASRMSSVASALRGVLADPMKARDDPFKRQAPLVIEAQKDIAVWAKRCSVGRCRVEARDLNLAYRPEWAGVV